jgi:hypothetical protein
MAAIDLESLLGRLFGTNRTFSVCVAIAVAYHSSAT